METIVNGIKTQTSLSNHQLAKLRHQAEELEGVFLNLLTKEMFATAKSENGFGGGFGEETWRSMQRRDPPSLSIPSASRSHCPSSSGGCSRSRRP